MFTNSRTRLIALGLVLLLVAGACGSSDSDDAATSGTADTAAESDTDSGAAAESAAADTDDPAPETETETETAEPEAVESDDAAADDETDSGMATPGATAVDVGLFFDGALADEVTTANCTLSGGAETTCYVITVAGDPVTYDTGPFCPETISDSADAGGIWFDGNGVYDLDGEFIVNLPELYGDDNWMMYDENGDVLVTETAEEFDLAARPDVDPSLQNHCVEGRLEWLENGEPVSTTVTIPTEPVPADAAAAPQGNLGVTLDGIVIAASAPVDAILGAYTIAAFDDCGGHYNPVDGYHLHGAVGCSELDEAAEGETAMFAYAMDGYPVHSPLDDPDSADLDECNGHTTEADGYHYHANNAAENQVIECLMGQTVATGDATGGRAGGPPPGEG